jgi:hypothetical protein
MAQLRDGEITSFEVIVKYVTAELAYTVWIERQQARLGGRQDITPFTPRAPVIEIELPLGSCSARRSPPHPKH